MRYFSLSVLGRGVRRFAGVSDVICALQRNPGVSASLVAFALLSNVALLLGDHAARGPLSLFLLAPVILAGLAFGVVGGLLLAVLCAAFVSPLVFPAPSDPAMAAWLIRSTWFVVVGGLVGVLAGNARDLTGEINRMRGVNPLTGLPDYEGARKHIELLLSSMPGNAAGDDIHVTQIRINNFDQLKTVLGVRRTEEILYQLRERIRSIMPADAYVNRSEPDLFTVVFSGETTPSPREQFKRLQDVSDQPFEVDGMSVFTDLVAGTASAPRAGTSAERLLSGAGEHLSARARRRGGDDQREGMTFIDGGPANLKLLGEVGRAIEQGEIRVVYQPALNLHTREFSQMEALARWNHPTRGLVPPSKFIPLIEQTEVVHQFTRWMFQEVVERIAEWHIHGTGLTVYVNLSARNLMDRTLLQEIPALLEKKGVPRESLGLEISEHVIMTLKGAQLERMRELKALGVKCTVDNFIGNRVPLTHLRTLPVDTIKLDVPRLCDDTGRLKDPDTMRVVARMAHDLGLNVTACSVENTVQLKEFVALGCDVVQGFLIARPMGSDKVAEALTPGGESSFKLPDEGLPPARQSTP
jgi:diguanylate cyclase